MARRTKKSSSFPRYLPQPNQALLKWMGNYLISLRGKKNVKSIANESDVSAEDVKNIESGKFHLNLGRVRSILQHGYGCTLEDVLAACYQENKALFHPDLDHTFDRDWHYRLRPPNRGKFEEIPTPVLIGGDPKKFLWAVPMRRLKNQPLVVELLELAPARKRKESGKTLRNSHGGVEVIHVIYGEVQVFMTAGGGQGSYDKPLRAGQSIHFHCRNKHNVENLGNTTSSLLQIVRLPQLPK
jgi:hypothetical protein